MDTDKGKQNKNKNSVTKEGDKAAWRNSLLVGCLGFMAYQSL